MDPDGHLKMGFDTLNCHSKEVPELDFPPAAPGTSEKSNAEGWDW